MSGVYIILLAAGASRRMRGRDKLIEPINGQPLLRQSVQSAITSSADGVIVVLPPYAPDRMASLDGLNINLAENTQADLGMSGSIICGLLALPNDAQAAVIIPADMPNIQSKDYNKLIMRWQQCEQICRATTEDGLPGHPVLFPRQYFGRLLQLTGDAGASALWSDITDPIEMVMLSGQRARTDLDTPEDWMRWRKNNPTIGN